MTTEEKELPVEILESIDDDLTRSRQRLSL